MARKEVNEVVDIDDSFDVAEIEQMAVATVGSGAVALGTMEGEDDVPIKLPYLSIVYGVSKIADQFDTGDLVLDKTALIAHKNEAMKFVVLSTESYWKEWFTPEEREIAQAEQRYERQFRTREEVLAAGGTTPLPGSGAWPDGMRPTFSQAMKINMIIRKPANLVDGMFGVTIGEHDYAPACWIVDKTTHKKVAPVIAGANKLALKNRGLSSGVFECVIKMVPGKRGTQPTPNVKLSEHLSDEELVQLQGYFA